MKAKMKRTIVPITQAIDCTTIGPAGTTAYWSTRPDWVLLRSLEGPLSAREGIDWVRGHDGPVVDAFRTAVALRPVS